MLNDSKELLPMLILSTPKPLLAACVFLLMLDAALAQSFVNGNLEVNVSPGCNWNMSNSAFNSLMTGVTAFGAAGEVDIQESTCGYSQAQSGDYFISIHQQSSGITDEVAFSLTSPLVAGNIYAIRYYDQANTIWDSPGRVEIGLSTTPNSFGTVIHSSYPEVSKWTEQSFTFTAPITASYVTVRVWTEETETDLTGWTFIDNFSFTCPFADLGDDLVLCEGDTIVLNASMTSASVMWQDGSSHVTYPVTEPGTYWVTVNYGNCHSSDTIVISGNDLKELSLGSDTILCHEKSLTLAANIDQAQYKWHDGSEQQSCVVKGAGTYWVTVTSHGCSRSDTVQVQEMDCSAQLAMPNVFTPNGDGVNDSFRPITMNNISSGNIIICNRWGEEVYTITDPAEGWDGRSRGTVCSEGVYFWIAEYTDMFGYSTRLTGTVTLLW